MSLVRASDQSIIDRQGLLMQIHFLLVLISFYLQVKRLLHYTTCRAQLRKLGQCNSKSGDKHCRLGDFVVPTSLRHLWKVRRQEYVTMWGTRAGPE